ncbi:MAG: hypothetical protein JW779_05360 [Candidatus Thorarchaeota archaeon]|nr:hypothetical protein [Candidatus Thorarchaeota archaeon]
MSSASLVKDCIAGDPRQSISKKYLDSSHPAALFYLGKIHLARGKQKDAKNAFKKAKDKAKKHPEFLAEIEDALSRL